MKVHFYSYLLHLQLLLHFYSYRVCLMLIRDDRSPHNAPWNQLCMFPSPTLYTESHRPSRRRRISALGLSEEGSNDDMICNAVFHSFPDMDICSLYYIWTNHRHPGKAIFVLYLSCIYTQDFTVRLSVPCSTLLNTFSSVEDSLVQFSIAVVKGSSRNLYPNIILYWVIYVTWKKTSSLDPHS